MKIPKIIHYVWLGGKEKPQLFYKCLESWKKFCPDYKIIEWNESNFDFSNCKFAVDAYKAKKFGYVADFIRVNVLNDCGGIYLDTDVEIVKSFDDLLDNDFFLSFENEVYVETATLGSIKKHPFLQRMINYYQKREFYINGKPDLTPNTPIFAIVLEKYVRPNEKYPDGRLIIIAGDKLVYDGELPYVNGIDGKREFPFVRQICNEEVGSFWGVSMISRLIPIQRAYNAVKNRKHEYINRLTLGVLAVEDGSVDIDNLEEEGLAPGKILVYRQGSTAPQFLGGEQVPSDFEKEEEKLLSEFSTLSGTSEIGSMENVAASLSGVALELLIDENETRLKFTTDSIKAAIKTIAKQILRLYKQFATFPRLIKIVGENGDLDVIYFKGNDISSDDVQFDTDNESNDTLSQRRNMIFTLLDKGLLTDENGNITKSVLVFGTHQLI